KKQPNAAVTRGNRPSLRAVAATNSDAFIAASPSSVRGGAVSGAIVRGKAPPAVAPVKNAVRGLRFYEANPGGIASLVPVQWLTGARHMVRFLRSLPVNGHSIDTGGAP